MIKIKYMDKEKDEKLTQILEEVGKSHKNFRDHVIYVAKKKIIELFQEK